MRVVFYTQPHFLEPALLFTREMSRLTEFHLVIELSPRARSPLFATAPTSKRSGVVPADPVLARCFPPSIRSYWQQTASFSLVYYHNHKSVHPQSIPVNHAAIRFLRDLQPHVLHFDEMSLRLALNFPELPRIDFLSVHDPEVHSGERDWRRALSRWLTFGKVNRFVLHNYAQTGNFCDRYRVPRNRVEVSHLGVYDVFREWSGGPVAEEERTILFFGRISKYKGLDRLYRAMSLVAHEIPEVRLIVAGRPEFGYKPPVPPCLPHGGKIDTIERYIPSSELSELIRRSAVVVCPYTDATQSGVVLTAYAFGKPVIATAVGGLPEYVENGVTGLVVPDDPVALAASLARVLGDQEFRHNLAAGVERVANSELSWRERARAMFALYQRAAQDR
jgi:glycosyltransferase involved in cell wall biosynthesis